MESLSQGDDLHHKFIFQCDDVDTNFKIALFYFFLEVSWLKMTQMLHLAFSGSGGWWKKLPFFP